MMKNNKKICTLALILTIIFSISAGADYNIFGGPISTPNIQFFKDSNAHTLTVAAVDPDDVLWSDIDVDGDCDTSGLGTYVVAGDVISSCYGTIEIRYIPTNSLLGVFDFGPEPVPSIQFVKDSSGRTLTVAAVDPDDVLWSDIDVDGDCDTSGLGTYVVAGDVISSCYGRIKITYTPTNTVIGIWDFSKKIKQIYYGFIFGTVFIKSGNSNIPLANATVSYRYLRNKTSGSYQMWHILFTDENGNYNIELLPDIYELQAGRRRPSSSIEIAKVIANESTKLDFILENVTDVVGKPVDIFNNSEFVEAIKNGSVGGEIIIWQDKTKVFEHEIIIYDSVTIPNLEVEKGNISIIVSGDESSSAKTIAIATDLDVFDITKDFIVEYDSKEIKMADNLVDALNPNNDGIHAEYLITIGTDGIEILISIPHFSEHEITISNLQPEGLVEELVESAGGVNAVILYISICIIASALFIGTIHMRRRF